jgi:hypothetical protein
MKGRLSYESKPARVLPFFVVQGALLKLITHNGGLQSCEAEVLQYTLVMDSLANRTLI